MKQIIILFSVFLAILSGLVFFIPTSNMGSMTGMMTQSHDECLFHCLTNGTIEIQNSVLLPITFTIIIGLVVSSLILILVKIDRSDYKVSFFDPLYLFKTVNLRE